MKNIDYSRVLQPQEDFYDVVFFKDTKKLQGWVPYKYPDSLLFFDKKIAVLPRSSQELSVIKNTNFTVINEYYKKIYPLGYNNLIELLDFYVPDIQINSNISGQCAGEEVGHTGGWGIMSTLNENIPVTYVNLMHELMHWKLVTLGFGTGANTFFPTTQQFILNDETELCWSIVNSYADTAQPAVGNKPTNRPVSASLHAYLSFLGVAYTYVQSLRHDIHNGEARFKVQLWGERFNKCLDALWKVGNFTDDGIQLMSGVTKWTSDFQQEYTDIKYLLNK